MGTSINKYILSFDQNYC